MTITRMTAKKVRVSDINNGRYFPGNKEDMKPSYIISSFGQKISRVNVVATVTDKFESENGNYASVTIDDGTNTIPVKSFGDDIKLLEKTSIGDLVLVIGKLKEYNGEIYILGELVRKVEPNYEILRKTEILNTLVENKKIVKDIENLKDKMSEEELVNYAKKKFNLDKESLQVILDNLKVDKKIDYKPKILKLIESLDDGDGVEISKILELSDLPENVIEKAINELLSSGVLFEPRPAILKRV